MKMTLWVFCLAVLASCHASPTSNTTAPAVGQAEDTSVRFTAAMVDNKKDPVCGMPSTAGLEDTIHYQGKVIGFCSDSCRNKFLREPAKYAVEYK